MITLSPLNDVLIANQWVPATGGSFAVLSPADGHKLTSARRSTWEQLDTALTCGHRARAELEQVGPESLAVFLEAYADAIEADIAALAAIAHAETGLPITPRLADVEIPGTITQLRMTARVARDRTWKVPTLSPAARVASQFATLPGVVVVFGPNNFPVRFNGIAGGDFAAAIATGHPVLAKAHPLHPATTWWLAELAARIAGAIGLPTGTVQMIYDLDPQDGFRLVADARVAATAFTGGRQSGLALKAAADAAGKPIYLELSSVNPVVVLASAALHRGRAIGAELAASVLNGMGQFCTCPGLVVVVGTGVDEVIGGLAEGMRRAGRHPMLSVHGVASFERAVAEIVAAGAVVVEKFDPSQGCGPVPVLMRVQASTFLADEARALQTEAFGPGTVVVDCATTEEAVRCIQHFEANLTGCVYADYDEDDESAYRQVEPQLRRRVGRLINNKVPTGVQIVAAMNHGGPYPATGHPGFTAVGAPATLHRFAVLQCYDNVPDERLPIELRSDNPLRLQRFVDGVWTDAQVTWGA
jgi:NADP-dependent aldehyde dehydrogenase